MTQKSKTFGYPKKIRFTLPDGSTDHFVTVKILGGTSYQTKGVQVAGELGVYTVTIEKEPGFLPYGSADVYIQTVDSCGFPAKESSYVICDNEPAPSSLKISKGPF